MHFKHAKKLDPRFLGRDSFLLGDGITLFVQFRLSPFLIFCVNRPFVPTKGLLVARTVAATGATNPRSRVATSTKIIAVDTRTKSLLFWHRSAI
jgi:hypothetical protein